MLSRVVNLVNRVFQPAPIVNVAPVSQKSGSNPFANPFIAPVSNQPSFLGKNTPIRGGYFAGYYNGKANIVGTRLFLEV